MSRSLTRLKDSLPDSALLTDEEWRGRHRVVLAVLAGLLAVVGIVGVVNHGPTHSLGELVLPLATLGIAARVGNRLVAMAVVSLGMLIAAGLMVHFTDGLIESHFTYFVVLPVIALYHDWRPFLLSALFVAVSHAVMGLVDPEVMYNHPAAIANPVRWGVIHALYLLGLALRASGDIAAGIKQLTAAAYQDWPDAHYALGQLYEVGEGVEEDLVEALFRYRVAPGLEHPLALVRVEPLIQRMSPGQTLMAHQRATTHLMTLK